MPGTSSFTRKRIDVTFGLGPGLDAQGKPVPKPAFAGTNGANQVTLSGLRCSVAVNNQGGVLQGELDLRVYGVPQTLMNQLSGYGFSGAPVTYKPGNRIVVQAGDDVSGLSTIYQGNVTSGWADYQASPSVAFHMTALTAYGPALTPVPPSSYRGGADVATIMADLAKLMGVGFENGGVSGIVLSNPYFPGTAYQQMERCRDAAGIEAHVIDGVLAIWPRGGSRGGAVPLISPETGMMGYPTVTLIGVDVTTLFNPSIRFGAKVQVQSPNVPQACGTWQVATLQHTLESETPNGAWFTRLSCRPLGLIGNSQPGSADASGALGSPAAGWW